MQNEYDFYIIFLFNRFYAVAIPGFLVVSYFLAGMVLSVYLRFYPQILILYRHMWVLVLQ